MSLLASKIIVRLFIVLTYSNVHADLVTLTFDELPEQQEVDGLTIQGVAFGYNGTFSNYHGFSGPLKAKFLSRPYLDGRTDGTLTLDFCSPTPSLEFAIAYRNGQRFAAAATVTLFDKDLVAIGQFDVGTAPLIAFTEGKFVHAGKPIRRAVINFDKRINAFFHLDNITFKRAEVQRGRTTQ